MGLSIHYQGSIKDISLINALSDEVADICKSMKWESTILDITEANVKGIVFMAKRCESICLTFNKDGKLICPFKLLGSRFSITEELANDLNYMCHTKTQYAGPDVHIALIELLRYLSVKYFSEFELWDEGLYWETNDKRKLVDRFNTINAAMDAVASTLSKIKRIPGESPASAVARIEKILKEKFGDKSN